MTSEQENTVNVLGLKLTGPRAVFNQISRPFKYLFHSKTTRRNLDGSVVIDSRLGFRSFGYFFVGCVWSLFVWSFVGVAIARTCLLRLTRNEQVGLDDAFEYAIDHSLTSAGAVGVPLLAVLALCVPAFLIGLLMMLDIGVAIVGLVWVVVLAIGAVMAILLFGLLFGWPLMVASVGAEGQNSFDAMTRAYAYTFQRPLHYIGYMLVAMVFGGLCWFAVMQLCDGVLDLSYWAVSWGTNALDGSEVSRIDLIQDPAPISAAGEVLPVSGSMDFGQKAIGFWNGLIQTVASAFIYGLFWCMASAIYLLLRKDVDDTEMDEIFLVDEKRTYELPPLKSDAQGIPQVQTPTPANDAPNEDTIIDRKDD